MARAGKAASGYALRVFPRTIKTSTGRFKNKANIYTYAQPTVEKSASNPGSIFGRHGGSDLNRRAHIVRLLEACLAEVQRQEAMFYAPFKPGDRIDIERQGGEVFDSFLVIDVLPDKKTRYCYECVALTKHGSMYKRGGNTRVWPRPSTTIRASEALLNAEGAWESEYFRRCAETSRVMSMEKGDVRLFEVQKTSLGLVHYRRKDMLDPLPPEPQ